VAFACILCLFSSQFSFALQCFVTACVLFLCLLFNFFSVVVRLSKTKKPLFSGKFVKSGRFNKLSLLNLADLTNFQTTLYESVTNDWRMPCDFSHFTGRPGFVLECFVTACLLKTNMTLKCKLRFHAVSLCFAVLRHSLYFEGKLDVTCAYDQTCDFSQFSFVLQCFVTACV
jgi:hypothetical protein